MRFIPISQQELVRGLLDSHLPALNSEERKGFQVFAERLHALYHSRYFEI